MANLSRDTFDKTKHYVKVILQQGVPWLDADSNEAQDIQREYFRKLIEDIVGDGTPDDGFKILENSVVHGGTGNLNNKFLISAGTYFGGGVIGIFESTQEYSTQVDWSNWDGAGEPAPVVPFLPTIPVLSPPGVGTRDDKVVLCLWHNEVDSVEDPNIMDPSLLVETCRRLKLMAFIYITSLPIPSNTITHKFIHLATIHRIVGKDSIEDGDITDVRADISQKLAAIDEVQKEVVLARDSSVYGAQSSLDARIEAGDVEVQTARNSSVYGAVATLDARIEAPELEIQTARGTQANLHTRLSVIAENNGGLKLSTKEDTVVKEANTQSLDFRHGLDVTALGGKIVHVAVDESELIASLIPNVPFGNIIAVTIQGAINELDTEKVARDGSQGLTANWDVGDFQVRAKQFYSDVPVGTAPMLVASSTKVGSLNVDQVDGIDLPAAISIVLTDHNKTTHDALGVDAATLGGYSATALAIAARADTLSPSNTLVVETRSGSDPGSPVNGRIWLRTDL